MRVRDSIRVGVWLGQLDRAEILRGLIQRRADEIVREAIQHQRQGLLLRSLRVITGGGERAWLGIASGSLSCQEVNLNRSPDPSQVRGK